MPSFRPPEFIHLRMEDNESQLQLITTSTNGDLASAIPSTEPEIMRMTSRPPQYENTVANESSTSVGYVIKNDATKSVLRWWRKRTALEISLLLLTVFLAVVITFALHIIARQGDEKNALRSESEPGDCNEVTQTPNVSREICSTKGCVMAANHLLMAINTSIDPCENFYEYSCGQWNRDHPIPDDMSTYGTFAYVRETVRQQMRTLLESTATTTSKSITMARISYRTCMNTTEIEAAKSSNLLAALDSLGHWPLLQPNLWEEENFDLTSLLASARHNYGTDTFFQVYVYADAKNTTRNTLYVDQGLLGLGRGTRDYYLNTTIFSNQVAAYKKYQREVVKLIMEDANISRSDEELDKDLHNLYELETKVAKIIVPEDDRRNNTRMYNKRRVSDLFSLMPQIDWLRFFHMISPTELHPMINNDTDVIVSEVEYMKKMSTLLESFPNRVKADYILWGVVHSWVKILDVRFEDIKQNFLRIMTGQQTKSPRWKDCVAGPTNYLALAAGALYVREHFDSTDKNAALEMIANLRSAFIDLLHENQWMDPKTKEVAGEKVGSMINHIGYPDFINNDDELDKYYEKLKLLPSDSYFKLLQKVIIWSQEKDFMRLTKEFDKYEFEVSPAVVNAFYSPEKNALTFPAGILKPPFFSGIYPKAVNYGAIGAVIGHEITHGFDDQGSQFDKNGNLFNWWNAESYDGFVERKKCIIDQYSSYSVPSTNFKINGKLTQGENIADNGGVKEAYRAYRKYVKQLGREEDPLPGLTQFSNDQIFFLSYAHFWCGHKKAAAAVQQVLTDEHSPEVFRVIGVLSNLEEFSKAFNCPPNSRLNPAKRCVVW